MTPSTPTTFLSEHGARFTAGSDRPIDFGDAAAEYAAAWSGAIVVDRSARGRIQVRGRDRIDLLHRLSTADVKSLEPGRGQANLFLTNKGRMLDYVDELHFDDHVLIVLQHDAPSTTIQWLDKFVFVEDVRFDDATASTSEFWVCGPGGRAALEGLTGATLPDAGRDHVGGSIDGMDVTIGQLPPLAGDALRILVGVASAPRVFAQLIAAGIRPAGTIVEEQLRIEAAEPRHGTEISDRWNPLEAGLVGAISFDKGCYTGQEVVARLYNYEKVQRRLVGVRAEGDALAGGAEIISGKDPVGVITSVAHSDRAGGMLGLAYIENAHADTGTRLAAGDRDVIVVDLPLD